MPYASWAAEFDKQDLAARNSPLIDDFIIARYKAVVADALKLADPPRSIGGRLVRRPLPEAGAQDAGPGTLLTCHDAAGKAVAGERQASAR